jgi:hypothetical protein
MSRSYTYHVLNNFKNSQLIDIKSCAVVNRNLQWGFFNVSDPLFKQQVYHFLGGNDNPKKIILGRFDPYSNILPISFIQLI